MGQIMMSSQVENNDGAVLERAADKYIVLEILASLRSQVRAGDPVPGAAEAYAIAEFGPDVIAETLASDAALGAEQ